MSQWHPAVQRVSETSCDFFLCAFSPPKLLSHGQMACAMPALAEPGAAYRRAHATIMMRPLGKKDLR